MAINNVTFSFLQFLVLFEYLLQCSGRELDQIRYPPCHFNPLCSCSKVVPDLGIVRCRDTYLARIPDSINVSKVFMLHLENNRLRTLQPYFLQSTGLYKVTISHNPLSVIPEEAFSGLERSLWELDLSYNQLATVPTKALLHLQRITVLNLSGNEIIQLHFTDWRGLENTLKILILSDNSITVLHSESFSDLSVLETLDLSGNQLRDIDPSVFRNGMNRLTHLNLADNQLITVPYQAVFTLKLLKVLDVSYNVISRMLPGLDSDGQSAQLHFQLNLDSLHLEYNQLSHLAAMDFQYFNTINTTVLDGNYIKVIEDNAFRQAKIRELYMRNCELETVSPGAFGGLENTLQTLDLSENNMSEISDVLLQNLQFLDSLSLRGNPITDLNPHGLLGRFQFTLTKLDISGRRMAHIKPSELRQFRNLRILSLSKLHDAHFTSETFTDFGPELEELEIIFTDLKSIKNNAFRFVHGLKRLHFSENSIETIEYDAFVDIEHSLTSLKMCHSLNPSFQMLPVEAFKSLTNIKHLDFSNNKIRTMPENTFHFMKNLKRLYLHDNVIENIPKGTFQGDIHRLLSIIYLSFNNIKTVKQHTFVDLNNLGEIHLDDNNINALERRAFMNLGSLRRLNLKGNKISIIAHETFQNLPELTDLDLSYNKLFTLDFSIFDQVGTLSTLQVNVSFNSLYQLGRGQTSLEAPIGGLHSNIKVLDLSHNNISTISQNFFKPVELSLTYLYLQNNNLMNISKNIVGNMPHLQILDLSFNGMYDIEFDTFRSCKKLQSLFATHNHLAEIPKDLFKELTMLRIVDLSYNRLRQLPDNLFQDGILEYLNLSNNFLSKLPLTSLSTAVASSLCELDLSWNSISSLVHGGLLNHFKNLVKLNLSYNRLAQIDSGTFNALPRLSSLDLSHNSQLTLEANGHSFQGLQYSLLYLKLDNVSLVSVPFLPTSNLISLSLAYNSLPTIPPEIAANLTVLRSLDISNNDLSSVPIVTHSLPELRYLSMANNPIGMITNTSLLGVAKHLIQLNMKNLDLNIFEAGAFCKMYALRSLKLNFYSYIKSYNLPKYLKFNNGLQTLEIHVTVETNDMDDELSGVFPSKLRRLILSGLGLMKLSWYSLQGISSPNVHLIIHNTSLTKIPSKLFENIQRVRNITLDIRENTLLRSVQNPSTGPKPNLSKKTFLQDVSFAGNHWKCDCDLGWIEVWQRKKRQFLCPLATPPLNSFNYVCRQTTDDFRNSLCDNKKNETLIEVLKSDIECGWSSGITIFQHSLNFAFAIALSVTLNFW